MKALKKAPEPSLLERIHAFRVELDDFIDAKAAELRPVAMVKTSPSSI
jgi:hypothetical protein